MLKTRNLIAIGLQTKSRFSTLFHNKFLSMNEKECMQIGDIPGSNFGTDLCGYLRFRSMLDPKTGNLTIPKHIKQIKIDIGLSFAAPNSAIWLENLSDRIVYGFEPNPENVSEILSGNNRKRGKQYHYVNLKYLNKRFFLFNAAIDNCSAQYKTFYMTQQDPGTSSLHKPIIFRIKKSTVVPCFRLSDFLSLIPWERFKYVEHIKIDTQGNDVRVLQSAERYLMEKVVFVTAECTARGYSFSHTRNDLDNYMRSQGFEFVVGTDVCGNKTYVNRRFRNFSHKLDYTTENL